MVNESIGKAFAGVTVLLICLGLLFGLALSNADFVRPITHVRPDFGVLRWRRNEWPSRMRPVCANVKLYIQHVCKCHAIQVARRRKRGRLST